MQKYLNYWHVDAPVFSRFVEANDVFFSERCTPLLERLELICGQAQPLVLLTGDAGSGKTCWLRWLAAKLPTTQFDVLLTTMVQRETQAGWLMPRLATYLGLASTNSGHNLHSVAGKLDELLGEQRKLIVVVDSAHLIKTPEAFDEIAALIHLQALAGRCLSFVLAGHHELRDTVDQTSDLAHTLGLHAVVPHLDADESRAYIRHRCKLAGLPAPFDDEAYSFLQTKTSGLPALLDLHAENCLIEAMQVHAKQVNLDIARAAAASINPLQPLQPYSARETGSASPTPRSPPKAPLPSFKTGPVGPEAPAAAGIASKTQIDQQNNQDNEAATIKLASLFKAESGNK